MSDPVSQLLHMFFPRKYVHAFVTFVGFLVFVFMIAHALHTQDWSEVEKLVAPVTSSLYSTVATLASPSAVPQVLGSSQSSEAIVTEVIDGDTIKLSTGEHLRYIGMDTPEIHHPTKGKQCFGEEAKERNSELVLGKTVRLEKDVSQTDRYGRLLRYVWVGDILVNRQLILDGFAHAATYPPDVARQKEFISAEAEARQQRIGLWSACPLTVQ